MKFVKIGDLVVRKDSIIGVFYNKTDKAVYIKTIEGLINTSPGFFDDHRAAQKAIDEIFLEKETL